jgi:hypothetical protein
VRRGPRELGADDVIHSPALFGKRREHEQRRAAIAAVREAFEHVGADGDERGSLEELAFADQAFNPA